MSMKRYLLAAIACGFLGLGLVTATSCTWLRSGPGQHIIDCTGLDRAQLTAEGTELLALVPDWKAIESKAASDGAKFGWKLAGCALAEVTQAFLTKPQIAQEDTWTARQALERFRATHLDNATLHTASGDL